MRWLIPRMSSFQRRRPGVEVRMTTSLAPVRFEADGYDVAIRGAQTPLAGCVSYGLRLIGSAAWRIPVVGGGW